MALHADWSLYHSHSHSLRPGDDGQACGEQGGMAVVIKFTVSCSEGSQGSNANLIFLLGEGSAYIKSLKSLGINICLPPLKGRIVFPPWGGAYDNKMWMM